MTKRIIGSDIAERDIDLRSPAVVDLRASEDATVVALPFGPEQRFTQLLADTTLQEDALLEAVIDLADAGVVPAPGSDPRTASWSGFVAALGRLGERSTYIGTFRVRIDEAVATASSLPVPDREVAALAVLDRTAAMATNARDFRHGILAGRTLDPHCVSPRTVVDNVLRPCLTYANGPVGATIVSYGLSVTLAVLAAGDGRRLRDDDSWALRAAVQSIPESFHGPLREQAAKLKEQDRRLVDELLDPDAGRRHRWPRRRRTPSS